MMTDGWLREHPEDSEIGQQVDAEMERLVESGGLVPAPEPGMCACGEPLHYTDPTTRALVEQIIAVQGEMTLVTLPGVGRWRVPRHFIALHGLSTKYLPALGFELVPEDEG